MMPVQLQLPLYHQLSELEVIGYFTSDGSTLSLYLHSFSLVPLDLPVGWDDS
jgi:hypothetical protein